MHALTLVELKWKFNALKNMRRTPSSILSTGPLESRQKKQILNQFSDFTSTWLWFSRETRNSPRCKHLHFTKSNTEKSPRNNNKPTMLQKHSSNLVENHGFYIFLKQFIYCWMIHTRFGVHWLHFQQNKVKNRNRSCCWLDTTPTKQFFQKIISPESFCFKITTD